MSLIFLLIVVGFIAYFAIQAFIAFAAIIAMAFFMVLMAPLVISSQSSPGVALCGIVAMGMCIWFLVAVFNPSTPKYNSEGKRSSNPFD